MKLRWYQYLELFGTSLIVASSAFQLFLLEPTLRRNDQIALSLHLTQTVQATRAATSLDNLLILKALEANSMDVSVPLERMKTNILRAKQTDLRLGRQNNRTGKRLGVDEDIKRYLTLGVFLFGSLLMGLGRFGHLRFENSSST